MNIDAIIKRLTETIAKLIAENEILRQQLIESLEKESGGEKNGA